MLNEREAYYWLGSLRTLPPAGIRKLLSVFSTPSEIFAADHGTLMQLVHDGIMKQETMEEMVSTHNEDEVKRKIESLMKRGYPFVTPGDEGYPELLLEIPDPPVTLFYQGDLSILSRMPCLAVVGSRSPSLYGKEMAGFFVSPIATAGVAIVSGLAGGIDTEAHKSALSKGKTVAVLGGGIDICYPQQNFNLYLEMCKNHLVLSEYEPGIPPLRAQFPLRNRIISGLSAGVLVVEAKEHSGTRITADAALDQGRNVYAVPGRVGDIMSEGTNALIRLGATLVTKPEDILIEMGVYVPRKKKKGKRIEAEMTPDEQKIYDRLSHVPVFIDDLISQDAGDIQGAFSLLLSMEQRGLIRQAMQGYYVRG